MNAAIDLPRFHLAWFDRWLKGVDNGVDRQAPVRIYVMGGGDAHKTPDGRLFVGGHWRDEQEWPLARTAPTPYYLHANGGFSPSLVFKQGHRIRLDISSSNFPRFDVNPNTGEPLNNNRRWRIAENTVYLDARHPSRIILPIIPASRRSERTRQCWRSSDSRPHRAR